MDKGNLIILGVAEHYNQLRLKQKMNRKQALEAIANKHGNISIRTLDRFLENNNAFINTATGRIFKEV